MGLGEFLFEESGEPLPVYCIANLPHPGAPQKSCVTIHHPLFYLSIVLDLNPTLLIAACQGKRRQEGKIKMQIMKSIKQVNMS